MPDVAPGWKGALALGYLREHERPHYGAEMRPAPAACQVWARRPATVWRRIGDEAVILDPEGGVVRGINLTAHAIWELLDGKRSLAEISRSFAATFAIPQDRAAADVSRFVETLAQAALVERIA
jgi:pyrroloquinoline quinone biosynthesis protein D